MEGTTCAQDAGLYSASLMKHLNIQRERGQFCDCVLRQNSDQVYPAHRCILAASSPVLASILSSTGALVELQDPCLSDSVIVSLLDYIYTGILPSSLSQQQYHRLLTAARHLQMKDLQEALRAAWRQLIAEDFSYNGAEIHTFGDLPLLHQTVQDSSNVGVFEEVQINLAGLDSRIKGGGNDCNRPDGMILNIPNSSCALESVDRVNAHDEIDVPHFAQQDLMQNGRASSEVCDLPGANQEGIQNEAKSNSFVNSEIRQRCTEGKMQMKSEGWRRSTSSSSTHLWCGAIPVIRYSHRASVLQLAETCEASQSSISSSMTPVSCSSSTDAVKGVTTKDQNGAESQDSRNHKHENVCIIHPDLFNSYSSSISHQLIPDSSEQSCKGHAPNTDHTSQQALRDSSQTKTNHLRDDLSQDKDQSRGLKHQMESDFDQFPSKHRRLDCYEWNVSLTREAKEQIKNWNSVDPLPAQDSETGSDSSGEDVLEMEVKEEQDVSGSIQDNPCDLNGPETNWYPNNIRQEYKPNITSTASESGLDDAPEPRNSTSTKSTESCLCVENMISGTIDQRYHGYLHYQCLTHQDAHLPADKYSKQGSSNTSNDSSDEEEAGSFCTSGQRPLMQLLSTENTNQVLLLDINTKPEMFGTFKHRSESEESIRDMAAIRNHDKSHSDESGCRAEGFEDADERKKVGGSRLGAAREASVVEGCCSNEDENRACSPPHGPDSVQTSMPSSLSLYNPSSLPADGSAHLSSPSHQPFQCSLCDRSFSQRGSLNRHVRSHLGVRPFPCPRCPMTFSRQYRVTEHMRVHLRCPLGNGFQKTSDSFIKDHEERPQS